MVVTATYRMNWAQALSQVPPFGLLDHTWSLSIEEQFYVLWPLVVVGSHRLGGRWGVLSAAVGGMVASAVLRGVWWHDGTVAHRVYYGLDTHADGILLGCALATLTLLWPRMPDAAQPGLDPLVGAGGPGGGGGHGGADRPGHRRAVLVDLPRCSWPRPRWSSPTSTPGA